MHETLFRTFWLLGWSGLFGLFMTMLSKESGIALMPVLVFVFSYAGATIYQARSWATMCVDHAQKWRERPTLESQFSSLTVTVDRDWRLSALLAGMVTTMLLVTLTLLFMTWYQVYADFHAGRVVLAVILMGLWWIGFGPHWQRSIRTVNALHHSRRLTFSLEGLQVIQHGILFAEDERFSPTELSIQEQEGLVELVVSPRAPSHKSRKLTVHCVDEAHRAQIVAAIVQMKAHATENPVIPTAVPEDLSKLRSMDRGDD